MKRKLRKTALIASGNHFLFHYRDIEEQSYEALSQNFSEQITSSININKHL
jgi:hypothetical protein